MTRLWTTGELLRVEMNAEGLPQRFVWDGKQHHVQSIANHWRVDLGWWRVRIWREHFKLITTSGLLLIIYHDLTTGQWYLQRVYD